MRVVVETARLWLREFTADDVEHLLELDSDPAVMRYITGGQATPRTEVEQDILPAYLRYHRQTPAFGYFAAARRPDGEFLGWFHLRPGEGHPSTEPELGYRLRRSAWGQGYAAEGARALVDHAFAHGAERVLAEAMVVHTASRRVMDKAGLRLIRTFHADWPVRIDGDEHGDVEYAITRDEWQSRRSD